MKDEFGVSDSRGRDLDGKEGQQPPRKIQGGKSEGIKDNTMETPKSHQNMNQNEGGKASG
jgi:hypothetical protein